VRERKTYSAEIEAQLKILSHDGLFYLTPVGGL
jgi:hypothetical protein